MPPPPPSPTPPPTPPRVICDLCNRPIPPHAHYIVRIDVFADPAMPAAAADDIEEADYPQAIADLLDQMKHMSPDELQDGVHRRFEFKICRPCQLTFLTNPLGKPRTPAGPQSN